MDFKFKMSAFSQSFQLHSQFHSKISICKGSDDLTAIKTSQHLPHLKSEFCNAKLIINEEKFMWLINYNFLADMNLKINKLIEMTEE